MKVINEKDYVFVGMYDGWFKFVSNPNKVNFDEEIILVKRARYRKLDGTFQFFTVKTTVSA